MWAGPGGFRQPDMHLNYMIDIALTAEFSLAVGSAR